MAVLNADCVIVTLTAKGLAVERGPEKWRLTEPDAWGIELALAWGTIVRPIPRFPGANPWTGGHRTVWRFPWRWPLPWFHIWKWRGADHPARLYVGGKIFYVDALPADPWALPSEVGHYLVTPSASFRTGR